LRKPLRIGSSDFFTELIKCPAVIAHGSGGKTFGIESGEPDAVGFCNVVGDAAAMDLKGSFFKVQAHGGEHFAAAIDGTDRARALGIDIEHMPAPRAAAELAHAALRIDRPAAVVFRG